MDIQKVFNVIFLGLSIATILLTLVSFVIYKIRQVPTKKKTSDQLRTQGVFFKRYLPAKPVTQSPSVLILPKAASIFQKTGVFFGIVAGVILLALGSQSLLSEFKRSRAQSQSALNFKNLMSLGLLKTYDLSGRVPEGAFDEVISKQITESSNELRAQLAKKKIVLWDVAPAKASPANSAAVASWKKFFEDKQLPFSVSKNLDATLSDADIILIIQGAKLNAAQRQSVEKAQKLGKALLVSGPLGYLDGSGKANNAWAEKNFGLSFQPNPEPKQFYATLFSKGGGTGSFDLPPGLVLNWLATDNSTRVLVPLNKNPLPESSFRGEPKFEKKLSVAHAVFSAERKFAWLAVDPSGFKADRPSDAQFVDYFLLSTLGWLAKIPAIHIHPWKNAKTSVAVVSVDSEDKFTNLMNLGKLFEKHKMPLTFFIVSNELRKHSDVNAYLQSQSFDYSSHSENHSSFGKQDLRKQFDRVQDSRLEIEELTGKKVNGFRPPEEVYDTDTITAVSQNRMKYFFGDNATVRFSPLVVSDGDLVYFPRVVADDYLLDRRRDLASVADYADVYLEEWKRTQSLGAGYFLSVHTNVSGEGRGFAALEMFAKVLASDKDTWRTDFNELSDWVLAKNQVRAFFVNEPVPKIVLQNQGSRDIAGLVIEALIPNYKSQSKGESLEQIDVPPLKAGASWELLLEKI